MMRVLDELDVAQAEDQVWLEPLQYVAAADAKKELDELLETGGKGDKAARRHRSRERRARDEARRARPAQRAARRRVEGRVRAAARADPRNRRLAPPRARSTS